MLTTGELRRIDRKIAERLKAGGTCACSICGALFNIPGEVPVALDADGLIIAALCLGCRMRGPRGAAMRAEAEADGMLRLYSRTEAEADAHADTSETLRQLAEDLRQAKTWPGWP